MRPRIAIPLPHSSDPEYAERAIPQYERAVELAGGDPVRIPLDRSPEEVMKLIERCDGVLLPGSPADVDPAKYGATRNEKTDPADPKRDTVDELLLQDAYNMHKPVLGICYGLQILNVYRSGTLLQHIVSAVNHEAGRKVAVAHQVEIEPGSKLAEIVGLREGTASSRAEEADSGKGTGSAARAEEHSAKGTSSTRAENAPNDGGALAPEGRLTIPANSSHHQSADVIGDGLKITARCVEDGIVEAIEGTSPDHFVVAVQWHPERSFDEDDRSRKIFGALVEAAKAKHLELAGEFEGA